MSVPLMCKRCVARTPHEYRFVRAKLKMVCKRCGRVHR